jgi:hypothetical protein
MLMVQVYGGNCLEGSEGYHELGMTFVILIFYEGFHYDLNSAHIPRRMCVILLMGLIINRMLSWGSSGQRKRPYTSSTQPLSLQFGILY